MDASHTPPTSSAAQRSSPHLHLSTSPALPRHGGTPPPRPRLFARTSADRKSPPPPARLAPLHPPAAATPAMSADSTSCTAADGESRPHSATRDEEAAPHSHSIDVHHRRHINGAAAAAAMEEDEEQSPRQQTPLNGDAWWTPSSPPSSSAFNTPLSHTASAHATRPMLSQRGTLQPKAALTPPRGNSAEAEVEWSGHGRVEAMLTAKRERHISSADTQHSMASSSTPPPRTKRAVSDKTTGTSALDTTERYEAEESPSQVADPQDRLRLSVSTSRSSSSRGATSEGSSSDLVATAAAALLAASAASPLASGAAGAAQCLVLDDSVDSTAVVSADQLRRLVAQAANVRFPESAAATPYETRLITAEVLRDWTGWEDLELVLSTQLRVDAEAMLGVDQMGPKLPRLTSLKLNGSRIPRLRQLGSGFHALKYLWLNSCHLTDLRGLAVCCPALVELYVSFNFVSDVMPVLALSATLEVLDVEGNLLDDASSLGFVLASLPRLTSLTVQGNPLTCEHHQKVRDAYAAITEEEEEGPASAFSAVTPHDKFADVLRAWVGSLAPHLQTLNDEPMQRALVTDSATTARRAVHVDPLDDRLAEELRLVAACVRDTDPFDPLREAVEEANQQVYSRPSTSCNGARPRLTPATAMGAARPATSARSSAASASRRLGAGANAATDASALTTGTVLAGSATASLRKRLATPTPPLPLTSSLENVPAGVNREQEVLSGPQRLTSTRLGEQPTHRVETPEEAEARVAALLADDSEEDEWEQYKSSLLMPAIGGEAAAEDVKKSDSGAAATAAVPVEEDGFDKDLKSEWNRLRLRMAKAGRY